MCAKLGLEPGAVSEVEAAVGAAGGGRRGEADVVALLRRRNSGGSSEELSMSAMLALREERLCSCDCDGAEGEASGEALRTPPLVLDVTSRTGSKPAGMIERGGREFGVGETSAPLLLRLRVAVLVVG